jgi:hypothetical protein
MLRSTSKICGAAIWLDEHRLNKYITNRLCFFLSSSNMATGCDQRSLDPFGVPLGVCMRNRKLCNSRSDRRSRESFGSVHGVFSTTSASYNPRKPRVLYSAWWLELALVICPFYFRIVNSEGIKWSLVTSGSHFTTSKKKSGGKSRACAEPTYGQGQFCKWNFSNVLLAKYYTT